MREEFMRYFDRRVRQMDRPFLFGGKRDWVTHILELIPSHWRSDARFFLAKNIEQMVVLPFYSGNKIQRDYDLRLTDAWPLIEEDVNTIVDAAQLEADQREREYVSATTVAVALGQLAPFLKTTSLQIWGPEG